MQQRTKKIIQIGIWVSLAAAVVTAITGFALLVSNTYILPKRNKPEHVRMFLSQITKNNVKTRMITGGTDTTGTIAAATATTTYHGSWKLASKPYLVLSFSPEPNTQYIPSSHAFAANPQKVQPTDLVTILTYDIASGMLTTIVDGVVYYADADYRKEQKAGSISVSHLAPSTRWWYRPDTGLFIPEKYPSKAITYEPDTSALSDTISLLYLADISDVPDDKQRWIFEPHADSYE